MNRRHVLHLTQANWLYICFGIAFKAKEIGTGPPSSCTNFVGFVQVITIAFIGNKPFEDRGGTWFLRILSTKWKFGTFFRAFFFGLSWLSKTTWCSTKTMAWLQGQTPHLEWPPYVCQGRLVEGGYVRISAYFTKTLFKGFAKTWGARRILCRCDNLRITWNWKPPHMWVVWHFG